MFAVGAGELTATPPNPLAGFEGPLEVGEDRGEGMEEGRGRKERDGK